MAPDPSPRTTSSEEVTQLIADSAEGLAEARDRLLDLVHGELLVLARSRMRGERDDHTLSATALVNEAYMRLFGADGQAVPPGGWGSRSSLFAAAATTMRRILVDHARARASKKRGGPRAVGQRIALDVVEAARTAEPEQILALDDALTRLEAIDERAARVVRLRFFAGLQIADIADIENVSERTIKRDWEFARAWLKQHFDLESDGEADA